MNQGLQDLPNIGDLFEQALSLHREGQFAPALDIYQQVVARDPQHAKAMHLLGFAHFQARRFDDATNWIQRALKIEPRHGEMHAHLGLVLLCTDELEKAKYHLSEAQRAGYDDIENLLHTGLELYQKGKLPAARTSFESALSIAPDSADAFHYLGVIHKTAGEFERAIECYLNALRLRPNYPEALNNLGNAYRDSQHSEEAIVCYEAALQLAPRFAAAHNNMGVAYANRCESSRAVECFEEAIQIDPQSADPFNNLGNVLRDLGRVEEAFDAYERARSLAPDSAEILNNLGTVSRARQQVDAAIDWFEKSLRINPNSVKTITNLASVLLETGRVEEAERHLRHAAERTPENRLAELRSATVCPVVFSSEESMERRWAELNQVVKNYRGCELPGELSQIVYEASAPPFASQFFAHNLRGFKEDYASVFSQLPDRWNRPIGTRDSRDRYRVGVVVTGHHEGIFMKSMRGVLERIDPERFELLLFCAPSGVERLQRGLSKANVTIEPLPWRLDLAASAIHSRDVDLLLYWEIGTDVTNYFLAHLRLAPVQCTSWGIQVTSGIRNIDYYLSSQLVEPPNGQEHYTEQLIRARTLLCYRQRPATEKFPSGRQGFGFSEQQTVYACPQQLGKFHPEFDWMLLEILRRDQAAVLALTADSQGHSARKLQSRFRERLADVCDRIVFLPRLDFAEYVSLLKAADVLLDPPHFGGVNSTYDGLSLGKPIVTHPSPFHRGRYTLGCYQKLGLDHCIAGSLTEYVEIACRLGADSDWRREVGELIVQRSDELFEDITAVAEHERILSELIEQHR